MNSRIRMTLSLGRLLTQEARLPAGAERQLTDPYADKHGKRNLAVVLLVVLAILWALWRLDVLNPYLPEVLKHATAVATPSAQGPSSPGK